jgi:hypothetical protein
MKRPAAAETWSTLVCLAEAVCTKIEELNPDVILVIYKSGSVVWRAAETWWQMTRRMPLPVVVGVNIGSSQFSAYRAEEFDWDRLEYMDWIDVGHLIAWVVRHDDWVAALRRRITEQSGLETPGSFLIIDDVIAEGRTTVLIKSLLWMLYPKAITPMVAGMDWFWRETLGEAWLQQRYPQAIQPAPGGWVQTEYLTQHKLWAGPGSGFPWRYLISGFASNVFAPFGWTQLQPPHPLLTYLADFLPVDAWLQFPQWVATTTQQMLERQLESGVNPLEAPPIVYERPWQLQWGVVEPQAFVCALAWQQPWVSLAEAAQRCNASEDEIQAMVADCARWDYLVAAEVEGVAGFCLAPHVEPRII